MNLFGIFCNIWQFLVRGHGQISVMVTCDSDKWQWKARTFECQCLPSGRMDWLSAAPPIGPAGHSLTGQQRGRASFTTLQPMGGKRRGAPWGGGLNRQLAPAGDSEERPPRAPFILDCRSIHVYDQYLLVWLGRKTLLGENKQATSNSRTPRPAFSGPLVPLPSLIAGPVRLKYIDLWQGSMHKRKLWVVKGLKISSSHD